MQIEKNNNYSEWYQKVIKESQLAENSSVRGCMVIKPWGYGIWENIQKILNKKLKETGHQNAYFPLMIPLKYLEKESQHIDGFAKECAIVTHSKLEKDINGKLIPSSPLEELLVVRPTSETIIGEMFSKWIQSYRDLPLLINQWANIIRWEMKTRMFLRTTEFLWQEGHTAHSSKNEALEETYLMLNLYSNFCENYLAIPVIQGRKTESEKFPGAEITLSIEAIMQDKKALQMATSHFLGQHFSKSFNIEFLDSKNIKQYAWTTSWGMSTRIIGAIVMVHGDQYGIIIPPKIAQIHIIILPVAHNEKLKNKVLEYVNSLKNLIKLLNYNNSFIEVEIDNTDLNGGEKKWKWIKKGVPLILEIGSRDIDQDKLVLYRRDTSPNNKNFINRSDLLKDIPDLLDSIQKNLLERAKKFMLQNIFTINTKEEFYSFFKKNNNLLNQNNGFVYAHWNGSKEIEEKIKKELHVTIRCIPLNNDKIPGKCIFTGEHSKQRVYFAKSY